MADPRLRQITIKTGVLRRLAKEKTVYEREVDQQKARIEKLRAEGKDDHVLRKVSSSAADSDDEQKEKKIATNELIPLFDSFFLCAHRKTKCCKNR